MNLWQAGSTSVEVDTADGPHEFVLERFPVRIGRSDAATIRLKDQWVSRHHCLLDCIDGILVVCDLGSRHGTWVNGQRVVESRLQIGDTLTLGMSRFRLRRQGDAFTIGRFRKEFPDD